MNYKEYIVKITVYTRAYNTEKQIEQCIQSILNQTLADFEYILVDNGSTDNTKDIIEKYSQIDKRIKKIRFEENRIGVLNDILDKGIEGKYFVTLDSDDWYEENFLETMYYFAENYTLDIAACGSNFHIINNGEIRYRKSDNEIVIRKNEFPHYFRYYHQFFRTMWAKLFKTETIMKADLSDLVKNNIKGGYGSDTLFSIDVLSVSNKIGISDKILHNYRVHNNSVSYSYYEKRIDSDIILFENSKKFLKSYGKISSENYHFIYLVYLNAIKDTINTLLKSTLQIQDKISELNRILGQPLTQLMLEYMKNDEKVKIFKSELVNVIIKIGQSVINNSNIMNLIYESICLLLKGIEKYIHYNEIDKHIIKPGYMLYMSNINRKSLFLENILLGWIKNDSFIIEYHEIIKDVYFKDFHEGLDKVLSLLMSDKEIKFEEEVIFMCLGLAAEVEEAEVFVYAKKLQCQLLINEGRFEEAERALNDLIDMCPHDEDVVMVKKILEEQYE
jgi:glycosyltransferase EpsH